MYSQDPNYGLVRYLGHGVQSDPNKSVIPTMFFKGIIFVRYLNGDLYIADNFYPWFKCHSSTGLRFYSRHCLFAIWVVIWITDYFCTLFERHLKTELPFCSGHLNTWLGLVGYSNGSLIGISVIQIPKYLARNFLTVGTVLHPTKICLKDI